MVKPFVYLYIRKMVLGDSLLKLMLWIAYSAKITAKGVARTYVLAWVRSVGDGQVGEVAPHGLHDLLRREAHGRYVVRPPLQKILGRDQHLPERPAAEKCYHGLRCCADRCCGNAQRVSGLGTFRYAVLWTVFIMVARFLHCCRGKTTVLLTLLRWNNCTV